MVHGRAGPMEFGGFLSTKTSRACLRWPDNAMPERSRHLQYCKLWFWIVMVGVTFYVFAFPLNVVLMGIFDFLLG